MQQQSNPRSFWYCTRENLMHFCEISSKFSFYCFVHTLISFHYIYWLLNFKLNKLTFENEFFFLQLGSYQIFLFFSPKGMCRILIDIRFHDISHLFCKTCTIDEKCVLWILFCPLIVIEYDSKYCLKSWDEKLFS